MLLSILTLVCMVGESHSALPHHSAVKEKLTGTPSALPGPRQLSYINVAASKAAGAIRIKI